MGAFYLLDGASLGGGDHKTSLASTAKYTTAGAGTGLATFQDDSGGRWIFTTCVGYDRRPYVHAELPRILRAHRRVQSDRRGRAAVARAQRGNHWMWQRPSRRSS
jgi:hypothetical protein